MNIQNYRRWYGNRPPIFVPFNFRAELERLSKATLMDVLWDIASTCAHSAEQHDIEASIREHVTVVLMHRNRNFNE
jgi:hypothetical protein